LYKLKPALIYAYLSCVPLYVGGALLSATAAARTTSAGLPACEKCGRELNKVKHHRPYGDGRACSPRCKAVSKPTHALEPNSNATDAAVAAAVTAEPKQKKKRRRADSDPGEQPTVIAISPRQLRVRAIKGPQPDRNKHKKEKEAMILAQLDETHQRRLAALAEAAAASSTSKQQR
jgi:hypothetical protein